MGDLQGPKIRVGKFRDGKVTLAPGDDFILDAEMALGDATGVGLDYKELPRDVKKGDTVLFGKYSGTEVKVDGQELLVMKEDDVMAILEG